MKLLLTTAATFVALGSLAAGLGKTVFGSGGLVELDGHSDGGPTAVRIDVQEGRSTGHILMAGEQHVEEAGYKAPRGPALYPELHISATQIRSVKLADKKAFIEAVGRYVSGAGELADERVSIKVEVHDGRGKKGEDYVRLGCYRIPSGEKLFEREGLMATGDIKMGGGK